MIHDEETFDDEAAAEMVVMSFNMDGTPSHIVILDEVDERPMFEIGHDMAYALARRLTELARDLAPPARTLRRASDVDRHLRALDG